LLIASKPERSAAWGDLLKEFDGRGGDRSKNDGTVNSAPTQKQVAEAAGVSERQRKTAVRVANVPAAEFEAAIENPSSPPPPQLDDLGGRGRHRVDDGRKPLRP
jgi:hypothetical protein